MRPLPGPEFSEIRLAGVSHGRRETVPTVGSGRPLKTGYPKFYLGLAMWMIFVDTLPVSCLLELKIDADVNFFFFFPPQQLSKKVNNIETGWALGATFHLLQSLGISH